MNPRMTLAQIEDRLSIERTNLRTIARIAAASYSSFPLTRASGKTRLIEEPEPWLKGLQIDLRNLLLPLFTLPSTMHGSVKGRSVISAVKPHCAKPLVITFDIRDCYPSITADMVRLALIGRLGVAPNLAALLAQILTRYGHLPQGAPSSPFLANVVLARFCDEATAFCFAQGLAFSIYADDVAISGATPVPHVPLGSIFGILRRYGFGVKRKKVQIQRSGSQKRWLSLNVDRHWPTVGDSRKRQIMTSARSLSKQPAASLRRLRSVIGQATYVTTVSRRQGRTLNPMIKDLRETAKTLELKQGKGE